MALKNISQNPIKSSSQIPKSDYGLRPYQIEAKRNIYEAWDMFDDVMFQMPTGTGKTVLFASIINELDHFSRLKGTRPVNILIIAHRNELIEQISNHLLRRGVHHGIIKGGVKKDYSYHVQVGSINTVTHKAREVEIRKFNFDYIIIDEAHHSNAESYRKLWEYFPKSKKLGVTATPYRLDGKGLCDLYETLILSQPVKEFIEQGFLSPYKYYSVPPSAEEKEALRSIKKFVAGDYDATELERKFDTGRIRARLYDSYQQFAYGKKGIVYAIKVTHSEHICEEYKSHGIKAVSISAKTSDAERKELVRKFKEGEIDVLVNVDIFSEGFDCPDIEFIQLARPTQSLSKYLQQVGRGLRITENKSECVILDNVGMYEHFGLPDANRKWHHHFLGKEIVESTQNTENVDSNEMIRQERDTSEGEESMILIQEGTSATAVDDDSTPTYPPFEMPDIKLTSLQEYIRGIGYRIKNTAFTIDGDIYDYIVTQDSRIVLFKVPIDEQGLRESYINYYEEGSWYDPFFEYWENSDPRVIAVFDSKSPIFSSLLKGEIPFSSIEFRPEDNFACLTSEATTSGFNISQIKKYNSNGELWIGEAFQGKFDDFFTKSPRGRWLSCYSEIYHCSCTIFSSTLHVVQINYGIHPNIQKLSISTESDLGQIITKVKNKDKNEFFVVKNSDRFFYYDETDRTARYFSLEGIEFDGVNPQSEKILSVVTKLEEHFIECVEKYSRQKHKRETFKTVLDGLYTGNFKHSKEELLEMYDKGVQEQANTNAIKEIKIEENDQSKISSEYPNREDLIINGPSTFHNVIIDSIGHYCDEEIENCDDSRCLHFLSYGIFLFCLTMGSSCMYIAFSDWSDLGKKITELKSQKIKEFHFYVASDRVFLVSPVQKQVHTYSHQGLEYKNGKLPKGINARITHIEQRLIHKIKNCSSRKWNEMTFDFIVTVLNTNGFKSSKDELKKLIHPSNNDELPTPVKSAIPEDSIDFGCPFCYAKVKEGSCLLVPIGKNQDIYNKLLDYCTEVISKATLILTILDKEYLVRSNDWQHPIEIIVRKDDRFFFKSGKHYRYSIGHTKPKSEPRYIYLSIRNGYVRAYTSRYAYALFDPDLNYVRSFSDTSFTGEGYLHDGKRIRI